MYIDSLNLINFRNFAHKNLVFDPSLTVIIGPNGSGKSNILEAVSLLSASRLRTVDTDLDLVKFGQSEAKVEGEVVGGEKKRLTVNFFLSPPTTSPSTLASL